MTPLTLGFAWLACADPVFDVASLRIDADGDGFEAAPIGDDCDDRNAAVHPSAAEVCDDVDNDCDGRADGANSVEDAPFWYEDQDGDGIGNSLRKRELCHAPAGFVATGGDCDDFDPAVPAGAETCAAGDEDCDGRRGDAQLPIDEWSIAYADNDADGFGDPARSERWCEDRRDGTVDNALDCDDTDPFLGEGLLWSADLDGDGFGTGVAVESTEPCVPPTPGWRPTEPSDCNDSAPAIHPDAVELPDNGVDENCNGVIDDAAVIDAAQDAALTWPWPDASLDGAGLTWIAGPSHEDADVLLVGDIGLPGNVYQLHADGDATIWLSGTEGREVGAGTLALTSDIDADGATDLVLGFFGPATGPGGFGFLHGPLAAPPYLAASAQGVVLGDPAMGLGATLSASTALDGDANAELLVGALGWFSDDLRIFDLPLPPEAQLGLATGMVTPAGGDVHDAVVVGDLDGDGIDEWTVDVRTQELWVFSGRVTGTVDASDAPRLVANSLRSPGFVTAAGDLDGDGRSDLLCRSAAADDGGGTWVFAALPQGQTWTDDATLTIAHVPTTAWTTGERQGSPGDLDGNGLNDIAVVSADTVDIFLTPATGWLGWVDADLLLTVNDPVAARGTGHVAGTDDDDWIVAGATKHLVGYFPVAF